MVGFMSRKKKISAVEPGAQPVDAAEAVPWVTSHAEGAVLAVHAQPGAKRDAIVGEYDGKLKVALTAPPVDGKANEKLMKFLASELAWIMHEAISSSMEVEEMVSERQN